MATPRTTLPGVQPERIINETLRRVRLQPIPASMVVAEPGSVSPGVSTPYPPRVIAADQTFTVPDNAQILFALTIDVEGTLVVEGDLVMVD